MKIATKGLEIYTVCPKKYLLCPLFMVADRASDEELRFAVECALGSKDMPLYESMQACLRETKVRSGMHREARRMTPSYPSYKDWELRVIHPILHLPAQHEIFLQPSDGTKQSAREVVRLLREDDFATRLWFDEFVRPLLPVTEENVTDDG